MCVVSMVRDFYQEPWKKHYPDWWEENPFSIPTIPITLPTTDSRVIPSAVAMESRRLASAGNKRLAELGIRLD